MYVFDADLVGHLVEECSGESIHYIGLGAYDFQLAFAQVHIQTYKKSVFSIGGELHSWEEGPAAVPVWMLIGQTPTSFGLPNASVLKMELASGDYVEFHTDEGPYESTTVTIGDRGGNKGAGIHIY